MADNIELNAGSGGAIIAADDITSVWYQINKLAYGALNSATLVTTSAGLPVAQQGTWTVDLGTTDNGVLDAIAASVAGTLTVAAHAVTNAGTFAVQEDGDALTALQLIDDVVYVDDADWTDSTNKHVLVGGLYQSTPQTVTDGDVAPFNITANGALHVAEQGTVTVDATGQGDVPITLDGEAVVLGAGTAAIGKLAANSGVDIGDVDVTSVSGNVTVVQGTGSNLHVVTDSGTITTVSTVTAVTAISNALPAGTNALGTILPTDIDVTAHTNYARKYYTSTGAATDGIIWSPGAGKRWHITSLVFQTSADATITFEDDKSGGDDPVLKGEFKAGSGMALSFDERYPFASGEDAADFTVTTSAGNIYVACVGYEV